jgi:predicted dienelactone hydrolase
MNRILPLCCILLCGCAVENEGVLEDTARNRMMDYKVWMPEQRGPAPLILLSHGSGGHYANHIWFVEALQDAGYIVAAVNHPFNNLRDDTPEGVVRVWDRPPDMTLLLDSLLENPAYKEMIDPDRIGAAGYSSGGYTVIALAGAIYELERMQSYCASESRGPDCDLAPMLVGPEPAASVSFRDLRINAVFAMNPAVGPAITPDSLARIEIPVEIVGTADDELEFPELNSEFYAENIPGSELVLFDKGGHFLFLECGPMTAVADFFISEFNLCGRGIDANREALHIETAEMALAFFDQHIG